MALARARTPCYAVLVPILLENVYVYCTMVQYVYKYYCTPFKVRWDKFAILEKKYAKVRKYFITYESTLKVPSKVRNLYSMRTCTSTCTRTVSYSISTKVPSYVRTVTYSIKSQKTYEGKLLLSQFFDGKARNSVTERDYLVKETVSFI